MAVRFSQGALLLETVQAELCRDTGNCRVFKLLTGGGASLLNVAFFQNLEVLPVPAEVKLQ